jgi:hypothetical protein
MIALDHGGNLPMLLDEKGAPPKPLVFGVSNHTCVKLCD